MAHFLIPCVIAVERWHRDTKKTSSIRTGLSSVHCFCWYSVSFNLPKVPQELTGKTSIDTATTGQTWSYCYNPCVEPCATAAWYWPTLLIQGMLSLLSLLLFCHFLLLWWSMSLQSAFSICLAWYCYYCQLWYQALVVIAFVVVAAVVVVIVHVVALFLLMLVWLYCYGCCHSCCDFVFYWYHLYKYLIEVVYLIALLIQRKQEIPWG